MITSAWRRLFRGLRTARGQVAQARAGGPAGLASAASAQTTIGCAKPVNGHEVLNEVLRLPISTWRYRFDPPHVRHLGPMAQDWHAAFGLGADDVTISCTDTNGVAMACIQGLHRLIEDLRVEVQMLRDEISDNALPEKSSLRSTAAAPAATTSCGCGR